jgi:glutamate synthase (NADPH/NADH) large chain
MMLIPEAWAGNPLMDANRRAFYEYHAALMEPWDGPAAVAFTDGRQIGATLDRNGLRPARFCVTDDDHVIMASESGVLPIKEDNIVRKWRLQPGKMLLIDMEQGRIIEDEEIKAELAEAQPYEEWLDAAQYKLKDLDEVEWPKRRSPMIATSPARSPAGVRLYAGRRHAFLEPMAANGDDPIGSMGTDTPIAVLSKAKSRLLYDYFKQNFAQVTNPPIDPIREELVMSLVSMIGPRPNLLGREAGIAQAAGSRSADPDQRRSCQDPLGRGRARRRVPHRDHRHHLGCRQRRGQALNRRSRKCAGPPPKRCWQDKNILILSDRAQGPDRIAMPACWRRRLSITTSSARACACRPGLSWKPAKRAKCITFCALAGYGAEAINPYVAFETLEDIRVRKESAADGL